MIRYNSDYQALLPDAQEADLGTEDEGYESASNFQLVGQVDTGPESSGSEA